MTQPDEARDVTPEAPETVATPPSEGPPAPADEPSAAADLRSSDGAMASEAEAAEEPAAEGEPADQASADDAAADELTVTQMALAERTADLQRLQAEFLNYKRRVDRDRELIRENATYAALTPIVDVLDTIDRAREHGDLDPGFRAVAEQLERVVTGLGLTKFGEPGDAFDPSLHEALSHIGEDPDVEVTTAKVIAKSGYRIGDRVVRAAQVLVVDPAAHQE